MTMEEMNGLANSIVKKMLSTEEGEKLLEKFFENIREGKESVNQEFIRKALDAVL